MEIRIVVSGRLRSTSPCGDWHMWSWSRIFCVILGTVRMHKFVVWGGVRKVNPSFCGWERKFPFNSVFWTFL